MKRVIITVPASTANLGPGFDCLGLALGLHNTVEMQSLAQGLEVDIEGEGQDSLPSDPSNLIVRAASRLFEKTGKQPPGLRIHAINRIPLSSGLGSSAAAAIAGLAAANALVEAGLTSHEILRLAYELEGHADNAAAALFGGLNVVSTSGDELITRQAPAADFKVAIALPALKLSTPLMREALPQQVPLGDAVFNVGRTALTIEALRTGDYELLGQAMADRLHQPYRKQFIPGFDGAMAAARRAGAAAVVLSGSGPALVAFAPSGHERIAQAMALAFEEAGLAARAYALPVDHQGLQLSAVG